MKDAKISRRGVYYDLSLSPYEVKTAYGDIFKFSSEKKLEIFNRDAPKELKRIDTLIDRHNVRELIPDEVVTLLKRSMLKAFYKQVER